MNQTTRGIFLHAVKYSESSLIASIYTEAFGRKSFIVNGVRSKNAKIKASIFQPLYLLEIDASFKPGTEIYRIGNARISEPFSTVPFDIRKSTQALFLSEILYKCLREEEANPALFEFIYHAVIFLDLSESGVNNFYLWFLLNLTKYLGIYPEGTAAPVSSFFDLKNATFVSREPVHGQFADKRETEMLARLIEADSSELASLGYSQADRKAVLRKLLDFYRIHFDDLGSLKSLEVLTEVLK